jgi:2-hydroxychromene-2-carboxylate isomerase
MMDFWYEFASNYSFLAAERVAALAEAKGVAVRWRPFLLGPILKDQGYSAPPFKQFSAKGHYAWRDTERWCDRLGIPFTKPDPFPQNGVPAARIALALPEEARPVFTRAVFRAEFCEGRMIDDERILREAVMEAGAEYETALETAKTDLVKDALRKETAEAQRLGIFGAPMFVTSDGELFWGNDRLEEALDWERSKA